MQRTIILALALVGFISGRPITAGDESCAGSTLELRDTGLRSALDAWADDATSDPERVGVVLWTAVPGLGEWSTARGHSDLSGTPAIAMTVRDRFRIGSITKPFVATVLMQLADEGVLDIDDALDRWVATPFSGRGISLRHLLSHTSGVFEYLRAPPVGSMSEPITVDEILDSIAGRPLDFSPGSGFRYSNTGFLVLGKVIEAATGNHWSAEVRSRILDPLGLSDTFSDGYEEIPGGYVRGYVGSGMLGWRDASNDIHGTRADAAGCMVSTATDLRRFFRGLLGGELVSADRLAEMREPSPASRADAATIPDLVGYGLGLMISMEGGVELFGHNGGIPPFFSKAWVDTSGINGYVALENSVNSDSGPVFLSPLGAALAYCESNDCEIVDCNGNGVADDCDLELGTSQDLDGSGVPDECETRLSVTPSSLDFGEVIVGEAHERTLIVRNDSNSTVRIRSASLQRVFEISFHVSLESETGLEPGEELTLAVVFEPRSESEKINAVVIRSDARFTPLVTIPVRGEGVQGASFLRSDANDDGEVDLSDASVVLNWLFLGGPTPGCLSSANTNGDEIVDLSDPVQLLSHLYLGGPTPVAPFPECGRSSLDADQALGCDQSSCS